MFKLDSPLMNFLNKVADIMILNLIVIVFSIPVITAGAALTAAYYIGYKMVKNEENYIFKGFLHSFKENFRQSTILWLIMLAIAGVIAADYRIMLYSGIEFSGNMRIIMLAVTIVLAMGAVFVFPMQARYTNSIKNTLKNALLMALAHLPTSFLLIIIYAVPVAVLCFIPQLLPALVLLAVGGVIYFKSFLLIRLFNKYEDKYMNKQTQEAVEEEGVAAESESANPDEASNESTEN